MNLEKCPDRNATVEFSLKTTMVSANVTAADGLSQMTDGMSMYDSGPETEYDFNDFNQEEKNDPKSVLTKIRAKINATP